MPTTRNTITGENVVGEISSPRTFGEQWSWPRAGAVTPPRQKTPPNFSWEAARAAPCVAWKDNGGGVIGQHDFPKEKGGEGSDRGDHFAADDRFVADKLNTATEGEGGWEAVWARRFARGTIHTEYQDRFLWPPPRTSSAPARAAAPSKTPSHFATDATTAAVPMTRHRAVAQGPSAPEGGKGEGEKSAAKVRLFDEWVGANAMASPLRRASPPPQEMQRFSPPPSSKRSSDISTRRVEGRSQGVRDRLLSEAVGSHVPAAARPAEESMGSDQGSAWEVVEHVGVGGDGAIDVNGQDVARPGRATAVAASLQSNLAGAGSLLRRASREQALKVEGKEDDSLGSRNATMRGGKTIDYSSQVRDGSITL